MCYPIVGAFQVDYPEACLLTLVWYGQACPICMTSKGDFNLITTKDHQPRMVKDMKKIYGEASRLEGKMAEKLFQVNGLVNAQV